MNRRDLGTVRLAMFGIAVLFSIASSTLAAARAHSRATLLLSAAESRSAANV